MKLQKSIILDRIEESKIAGKKNLEMFSKLNKVDLKQIGGGNNFEEIFKNPKIIEILKGMNNENMNSDEEDLNELMKDENIFKSISSLNQFKSKIWKRKEENIDEMM